jgi:hypothetical protein
MPLKILLLLLLSVTQACGQLPGTASRPAASSRAPEAQVVPAAHPGPPVKAEIRMDNGRYRLYRGDQPYFIKGAVASHYYDRLAAYGGNSVRIGAGQQTQELLDEAYKHGLSATVGIRMGLERHGFDYNDAAAVRKQLEEARQTVLRFKDHPAVLIWGIGNELELDGANEKVWDAVNEVSRMIHALDPNHLTTTMTGGLNRKNIQLIKEKCPDLDLLAVNSYARLTKLPQELRDFGWVKPYIVSEWGPTGHWEVPRTDWTNGDQKENYVAIEETSTEKAKVYRQRYETAILQDKEKCLGSYVFLWRQHQERTHTWYGMFFANGEETEAVETMQYLWSGKWPENRAPRITAVRLDGKQARDKVRLRPGQAYPVQVAATDPNNDRLTYKWEVLPEGRNFGRGGDREDRPASLPGLVQSPDQPQTTLQAPAKPGPYRLFVYVYDGRNKVATANIPFLVEP